MKNFDKQISKQIYDYVHKSPSLTFFAVIGAKYLLYVMGFFLVLITPDVFPLSSFSVDRLLGLVQMIGFTWLVTFVLQMIVRRKRPFECKIYEAKIPLMCKTPSFPSAHSSLAFAIASLSLTTVSWWMWNILHVPSSVAFVITGLFFLSALWVAISRVAVGVHYLSDVLVGSILGFLLPWVLIFLAFTYGM